jgi:clan AA aspartic protease
VINGAVLDLQARVNVAFRRPNVPDVEIEFVVDTGFAGALVLPVVATELLGLPYLQEMVANLANDDPVKTDVHIATIVLDGQVRQVAVLAMGKRPLLGTALLADKELVAQFVENGLVTIDNL